MFSWSTAGTPAASVIQNDWLPMFKLIICVLVIELLGVRAQELDPGALGRRPHQHRHAGIAEQRLGDQRFRRILVGHRAVADVSRTELGAVADHQLVGPGGHAVHGDLDHVERRIATHVADERAPQIRAQPKLFGEEQIGPRIDVTRRAGHHEAADAARVETLDRLLDRTRGHIDDRLGMRGHPVTGAHRTDLPQRIAGPT